MLRLASVLALAAPCLAQGYEVVTIPISNPFSINSRGMVAGDVGGRAAVWTPNKGVRILGDGEATGLNDRGMVIGSYARNLQRRAYAWTPARGLQDLGVDGRAFAVNNAGFVVGGSSAGPFLWHKAMGAIDLAPLVGAAIPTAISGTWIAGNRQGFGWAWNRRSGLHMLPGPAFDVNDRGQVVGSSGAGPYLWDEARGVQPLGTLGGPTGFPSAINNHGTIVGSTDNTSGQRRATLWQDGQIADLSISTGISLDATTAINDRGWIVAVEYAPTGSQTFLLIPR